MNTSNHRFAASLASAAAVLLMTACMATPVKPDGAAAVRTRLAQLQADQQLASRAPEAIKDAEVAVTAAEVPREDIALSRHLVVIADRKVDTAWARAQSRLSEDQRKSLSEQGQRARLDSRTREADNARSDAASARRDADMAQRRADSAHSDAAAARGEADLARLESSTARQQSEDLRQQLAELNAKSTDRGLVMTLGDVLFASGGAALKGNVAGNLGKLATFLNKYPDRTVQIEGHTDSVGNPDSNERLSQRRADAVKSYLVAQGVDSSRITTSGMGEGSPAAGNDSATGRQQNRRVEVIISNTD